MTKDFNTVSDNEIMTYKQSRFISFLFQIKSLYRLFFFYIFFHSNLNISEHRVVYINSYIILPGWNKTIQLSHLIHKIFHFTDSTSLDCVNTRINR